MADVPLLSKKSVPDLCCPPAAALRQESVSRYAVQEMAYILISHKYTNALHINPLPLLFKSLLPGQENCVFFSGHLNLHAKPETGIPYREKNYNN
jgi:hypothetical protein